VTVEDFCIRAIKNGTANIAAKGPGTLVVSEVKLVRHENAWKAKFAEHLCGAFEERAGVTVAGVEKDEVELGQRAVHARLGLLKGK
jgi:hypothetical protein